MLFPSRTLASVLLALACSACASSSAGGAQSGQGSALRVVTFTPRPGQAIPSMLVETPSWRLAVTVRHGFACFTMSGTPVAWPAGFTAVASSSGQLEVRTTAGGPLLTGGAYRLDIVTIQSSGDACSSRGQNVTAVLDIHAGLA